jgi:hypothetical protein
LGHTTGKILGFGNHIFPAPQDPPAWATHISLPTAAGLLIDSFFPLIFAKPLEHFEQI